MRRRMTIMVAIVAVTWSALFATAAYAATTAIYGTSGDDPFIQRIERLRR